MDENFGAVSKEDLYFVFAEAGGDRAETKLFVVDDVAVEERLTDAVALRFADVALAHDHIELRGGKLRSGGFFGSGAAGFAAGGLFYS